MVRFGGSDICGSWVEEKFRVSTPSRYIKSAAKAARISLNLTSMLIKQGPDAFSQYLRHRQYEVSSARLVAALPSPVIAPRIRDSVHPSVLFITGILDRFSKRYRAYNIQEQLQKQGTRATVINEVDIFPYLRRGLDFDVIVFQRVGADPAMLRVIAEAKARGIATAFEIDDYLVFDADMTLAQESMRDITPTEREITLRHIDSLREQLLACDTFIGTTQTLADAATKLGRTSFVIRNGLNDRQLALADQALARSRPSTGVIRIGYQPGTRTHGRDFQEVASALGRILDEFPQTRLVVQGPLALPEALHPFAERIERWPFVSWERLVEYTARLDIVIAPLETGSPINEAKSALKYFEPALVSVPVIASPTEDFRQAIIDGVTGYLARDEAAWYRALSLLVSDGDLRRQIGRDARADALARYTSTAQSASTLAVFSAIAQGAPSRILGQ